MFGIKLLRARIRDKGVDQGGLLLRQEGLGNLHLKIIRGFTFPNRKEREGRCFFLKNPPLRMSKRVLIPFLSLYGPMQVQIVTYYSLYGRGEGANHLIEW